jgi:RimJ/RimL family protein N-acetyltransferase
MPTQETSSELADEAAAVVCCSPAQAVETRDFIEHHYPMLERDEVRHNLILSTLDRLALDPHCNLRRWSFGAAGACAAQSPGYPIVLGELSRAQSRALAEETRDLDYPGVVGPEQTAPWFAERALQLGLRFLDPIPQQIHVLREKPNYPGAPGHARVIAPADVELFADWTIAFTREAMPHNPPPSRDRLAQIVADGRHQFWIVDGEPAAMAGIVRQTRHAAAIASVYTPPSLRERGYAGSVTAAVVERIFTEGKTAAFLYTDLRNPASNRCYAKIGFKPACRSWYCPRVRGQQ